MGEIVATFVNVPRQRTGGSYRHFIRNMRRLDIRAKWRGQVQRGSGTSRRGTRISCILCQCFHNSRTSSACSLCLLYPNLVTEPVCGALRLLRQASFFGLADPSKQQHQGSVSRAGCSCLRSMGLLNRKGDSTPPSGPWGTSQAPRPLLDLTAKSHFTGFCYSHLINECFLVVVVFKVICL